MELPDWAQVDSISLHEASCLIGGLDPSPLRSIKLTDPIAYIQRVHLTLRAPWKWIDELSRAVKAKVLPADRVVVKGFGSVIDLREIDPDTVGPHEIVVPELTTVSRGAFLEWCVAKKVPVPWPYRQTSNVDAKAGENYPDELRAAIAAFEAVNANPSATAKRTPKAALAAWLEVNRPELSSNARERIATVANWQPAGGAPKTPGG